MSSKFITFHSMIAGTTKQELIVEIAKKLAKRKFRVLLIDGYMYKIGGLRHYIRDMLGEAPSYKTGANLYAIIQDYETICANLPDSFFVESDDLLKKTNFPDVKKRILKIPNSKYLSFLPGNNGNVLEIKKPIDFDSIFDKWDGKCFFHQIKKELASDYDFILCDTNTGYETLAGIICAYMSDLVLAINVDKNETLETNQSYQVNLRLTQRLKCAGEAVSKIEAVESKEIDKMLEIILESNAKNS